MSLTPHFVYFLVHRHLHEFVSARVAAANICGHITIFHNASPSCKSERFILPIGIDSGGPMGRKIKPELHAPQGSLRIHHSPRLLYRFERKSLTSTRT